LLLLDVVEGTLCFVQHVHRLGKQLTSAFLSGEIDRCLAHADVLFEGADHQPVVHGELLSSPKTKK